MLKKKQLRRNKKFRQFNSSELYFLMNDIKSEKLSILRKEIEAELEYRSAAVDFMLKYGMPVMYK